MLRLLASTVLVALAAGCGGEGEARSEPTPAPPSTAATTVRLAFSYHDGNGGRRRASLACTGSRARATGYLARRDERRLCRRARTLRRFLTTPPDRQRACTEIYGGADTARVRGTIGASKVNRPFSRVDGCEIDDWDRMTAAGLLPRPRA
jgi:hypothetical protein